MIKCRDCKKEYDESEFRSRRGLNQIIWDKKCKACKRKYNLSYYKKHAEKIKVQTKAYRKTARGKEAQATSQRTQYKKSKQKFVAMGAVRLALEKGLLKRKCCEVCGEVWVHAHHDDYEKLIDVRWFCPHHHREWHNYNKPKNGDIA